MTPWPKMPVFPLSMIPAFLLVYLICESPVVLTDWILYLKYRTGTQPVTEFLWRNLRQGTPGGEGAICLAAAAFGIYRGVVFHPYFRPAYREWLERTPWTWPMPLPLGPVSLVWQDAVAPVLLGLIALRHEELAVLKPALIMAATYLAILGVGFSGTGQWLYGYAVFFLLGLMFRFGPHPPIAAAVAVLAYVLCLLGLRVCLAAFPWRERSTAFQFWEFFDVQKQYDKQVGWPFWQLSAVGPTLCVPAVHGLLISLLAAWWLYAGASIITNLSDRAEFLEFAYGMVGFGALAIRIVVYVWGCLPPISFWGRVRTLRWIIPGYDQIFLAPLSIAAVGTVADLASNHVDLLLVAPMSVFLTLLIAFNMGPSLRSWHTTGKHRMSPMLLQGQARRL